MFQCNLSWAGFSAISDIQEMLHPDGQPLTGSIPMPGRDVRLRISRIDVGRVPPDDLPVITSAHFTSRGGPQAPVG